MGLEGAFKVAEEKATALVKLGLHEPFVRINVIHPSDLYDQVLMIEKTALEKVSQMC